MQGLRGSVAAFSRELHTFSQQLQQGVEEVKRSARSKPCVGASTFRESLEELGRQSDGLEEEISELEGVTVDAISLEELLGHCKALLADNGKRVEALEAHLRQHGYEASFEPPAKPTEQPAPQVEAASPAPQASDAWGGPSRRRSYSSPALPTEAGAEESRAGRGAAPRLPTVTPSPSLSSVPSIRSISPSLRELQLKYGPPAASDSPAAPAPAAEAPAQQLAPAQAPSRGDPPTAIAARLTDLRLVPPCSSIKTSVAPSDADKLPGSPMPSVPPTPHPAALAVNPGLTINTGRRAVSMTGDAGTPKSVGTPGARVDIIAARLAAGEAPWDMLSLKAAINAASAGAGQVECAIASATFKPQAAAFTSLLHMCAKHKLWQKALEVFEAMQAHHPGVEPNKMHFSSLISACGTAGRWQEATRVFEAMKAASRSNPQCAPNVITFSALMSACCAGGRPDKAHEVFRDMRAHGIQADHISYSTLIAGYERWGDLDKAKQVFEEMREEGLLSAANGSGQSPKLPAYLEQFSRKLQRAQGKPESGEKAEGHRSWPSFAGSAASVDSPHIAAHYGGLLSRGASQELGRGEEELLHARTPTRAGLQDRLAPTPGFAAAAAGGGQQTPAQLLQAARGGRGRAAGSALRGGRASPLSHSFDAGTPMRAPPGFGQSQAPALERAAGSFGSGMLPLGSEADALSQRLAASTPGLDVSMASQLLGALVQQQLMPPAAMSPLAGLGHEALLGTPARAPAAAASHQMAQVSVEEYNNLPLRFSRQLSLDQLNDAVDYCNALVEGRRGSGGADADSVTHAELLLLQLGNQRTTALLNCLLALKRVRLLVRGGQQHYALLPPQ